MKPAGLGNSWVLYDLITTALCGAGVRRCRGTGYKLSLIPVSAGTVGGFRQPGISSARRIQRDPPRIFITYTDLKI